MTSVLGFEHLTLTVLSSDIFLDFEKTIRIIFPDVAGMDLQKWITLMQFGSFFARKVESVQAAISRSLCIGSDMFYTFSIFVI